MLHRKYLKKKFWMCCDLVLWPCDLYVWTLLHTHWTFHFVWSFYFLIVFAPLFFLSLLFHRSVWVWAKRVLHHCCGVRTVRLASSWTDLRHVSTHSIRPLEDNRQSARSAASTTVPQKHYYPTVFLTRTDYLPGGSIFYPPPSPKHGSVHKVYEVQVSKLIWRKHSQVAGQVLSELPLGHKMVIRMNKTWRRMNITLEC